MTETEIERLVVTVVAKTQDAIKDLDKIEKKTNEVSKSQEAANKREIAGMVEAMRRHNLGRGGRFAEDVQGFAESAVSANNYGAALQGLGVVYGAFKVAQMAMANDQEEINYQLQKGAELSSKMQEAFDFRHQETKEMGATLAVKDRIKLYEDELAAQLKIADQQKKNLEAQEQRVKDARGPMLVGNVVRSVNAGGRQTRLEEEEAALKAQAAALEGTRNRIQDYRRSLNDLEEGGDNATMAFNRFKLQMEAQTAAVGKGHKALTLYRLEQQNLSKEQLEQAEALFDALQDKRDYEKGQRDMEERLRRNEEKRLQDLARTRDQFATPQENFDKRKEELDTLKALGLEQDVYNRALEDAQRQFFGVEKASKAAHRSMGDVSHSLAGSLEAKAKITSQSDRINNRDPMEKTNKILTSIDGKLTKPQGVENQKLKPAGVN